MTRITPVTALAAAGAALALTLVGCSATAAQPEAQQEPTQEWPRTIEIPAAEGGEASTLTLDAEPQTIAAVDYESAEVLAELGLGDRLVLIPEAVLNPALGGHIEQLAEVPNTIPVAMELDAETVIALQPDLVVMSPRHGAEASIGAVLDQAGIASLQLPASWTDPDSLTQGIGLIGEATGSEQAADKLVATLTAGLEEAAAAQPATEKSPRVLVLTNQAGRPFATAGHAYPLELLRLAGAQSVSEELGLPHTGPISAEQIAQANPDGVLLIDMNGSGDRMYTELLANPAVASLDAIAQQRVLRLEGKQVQAMGLTSTVDGLSTLTEWVAGLH